MVNFDITNITEKQTLEMERLTEKFMKIDIFQLRLSAIETKQDKLQFGEFMWKIDNFSDKKRRAQNGIETEIYSDTFYSHKNRYKMCLSVYPNGFYDDIEDGSYLGVLFHIMRGPLDNALKWPFKHDVTVALIDQQTGIDFHSHTFKYHHFPNDVRWNKPTTERNGGLGTYYFIELTQLLTNAALCKNNQIIVKCTVRK